MKLLITGATGFLGSHVVRLAIERGHEPLALVQPTGDRSALALPDSAILTGDLGDPAPLPELPRDLEGVIHCAAATAEGKPNLELSRRVNVEGTRRLLEAAARAGRPHWIQISSMSAHAENPSVYGRTKYEADRAVEASGLPYAILKPSIIYGPGGRGVAAKTVAVMRKLPIVPVVGAGRELLRPVHVEDVARAALDCLERPETARGKTYMIGGAEELSFNEFLVRLGEAYGIRRPVVHVPIPLAMGIARALGAVTAKPPLTTDNVLGVKHARRVDIEPARRDFDFDPMTFEEGLRLIADAKGEEP